MTRSTSVGADPDHPLRALAYLASSQIANVAQVGSTPSLIPGAVTNGYNMSLLPFVMESGEMLHEDLQHQRAGLPADVRNADQQGLQSPVPELRHTTVRPEDAPAQQQGNSTLRLRPDHRGHRQGVSAGDAGFLKQRRADLYKREVIVVLITARAGLNHGEA